MRYWSRPESRRWLLWGLLATTFLLVNVYRLSTAVIAEQLMAAFEISGAALGTLHATFFFVYAVMQIPTGLLVDRFGPRRTATVGAVVLHLGALFFAVASGFASAFVGRFLIGLGGSVIFVSTLRFCANWYSAEEFGTMNGLSFAVAGVGGIIATTPLALLTGVVGWRGSIILIAAAGLVLAVAVFAFVRDSPQRAGFDPIENVPERPRPSAAESWAFFRGVAGDRVTWVVFALLFCTGGVNLTLFGLWGVPYVVQVYDTSVTTASLFTLMGGIGAVVGPPAFGRLSDRTGYRTEIMVVSAVIYVATLAVFALLGNPPLAFVGLAFLVTGSLLGAFVLTYPMVVERNPARASGIALGTINGSAFFGAAVFPSAMGLVLDAYWTGELAGGVRVYTITGYRVAFALATLAGVVALGCTLWLYHEGEP